MVHTQDEFEKLNSLVSEANNIMVCINCKANLDVHASALAFILFLKDLDKKVRVVSNGELPSKSRDLFEHDDIGIINSLDPRKYIVTLDHSKGDIERVSYDDKDGKFYLYITPTSDAKEFDFSRVEFSDTGDSVDLIVSIGSRKLEWFGDIYTDNKQIFEDSEIVNINNLEGDQEFGDLILADSDISVAELIFSLIKNNSSTQSINRILEVLLLGLLENLQPLNGLDVNSSSMQVLADLVKMGGDFGKSIQSLYFNNDIKNFLITQRASSNIRFDENMGVVWSVVDLSDFEDLQVDGGEFDLSGKLFFNNCKSFRVAFSLYEIASNEVLVELESNEESIDARDVVKSYKASGNSARVVFKISGKSVNEVEETVLRDLGEYLVEIDGVSYSGESEDLTKGGDSVDNTQDIEESEDSGGFISPPPISPSE